MTTQSNPKDRLKQERKRLGFSQTLFGNTAGVSKNTQINYENGGSLPSSDYLIRIAVLGADIQYILTGIRSVNSDRAAVAAQNENNIVRRSEKHKKYAAFHKGHKNQTKKDAREFDIRNRETWMEMFDLLNKDDRKHLLEIGTSLAAANAVKKRNETE